MFKLSEQIAKLEDRWGKKLERLLDRHRGKWKLYVPIGLSAWYFYGMLINSVRLGTRATFNQTVEPVGSIWMVNPFRNFIAVFTSNKTFSQWNEVFADVTIASAILDRVLHHCTVIKKLYQ